MLRLLLKGLKPLGLNPVGKHNREPYFRNIVSIHGSSSMVGNSSMRIDLNLLVGVVELLGLCINLSGLGTLNSQPIKPLLDAAGNPRLL